MAEFLSDEWIAALATACRSRWPEADAGRADLVVEPAVREVPGRGVVRYRLSFDERALQVGASTVDAAPADVSLETDYETAVALARGDTNAQSALADGRLRVSGDVARMARRASDLGRLDDVFGDVRATTTYSAAADRS